MNIDTNKNRVRLESRLGSMLYTPAREPIIFKQVTSSAICWSLAELQRVHTCPNVQRTIC